MFDPLTIPKEHEVATLLPDTATHSGELKDVDDDVYNAFFAIFHNTNDDTREAMLRTVVGFDHDEEEHRKVHEHYVRTSPYVKKLKERIEDCNRVIGVLNKRLLAMTLRQMEGDES